MSTVLFWGSVNAVFISVSVYGIYSQLSTIWQRRRKNVRKSRTTALLSLNQFSVSFFAYLSFFVYGYSTTPFNHFIVWPRLAASLFVLAILFEVWRDRKSLLARVVLMSASSALVLGIGGLMLGGQYVDHGKLVATTLILLISILLVQGYTHQIFVILKRGDTGAVDIKMSQFILLMDFSTMALVFAVGIQSSWPLLVLALTSAVTKIIILYLFYWVRVSNVAQERRIEFESLERRLSE